MGAIDWCWFWEIPLSRERIEQIVKEDMKNFDPAVSALKMHIRDEAERTSWNQKDREENERFKRLLLEP